MEVISELLSRLGGKFSTELGLKVAEGPEERQKWFLAALLFGAPISGFLASRTYRVLADQGVTSPDTVLARGWDGLVVLLDEGGYARYDFKTATKLLTAMTSLKENYQGDLERLAATARDYADLEQRLRDLASGIGPTTVNIFLRELRDIWPKAQPPLSSLARLAAAHLGLIPGNLSPEKAWKALAAHWQAQPAAGFEITDLEAALVRLGRDFCRKPAKPCPMKSWCKRPLSSPK
jgi:endonuclease III